MAARYGELLADTPLSTPQHLPETNPVYHCYVVRSPRRDATLKSLQAAGVGAGVHYPIPLHLQPAYRSLEQEPGSFPISEQAARAVITLPLYAEMTETQQNEVVSALRGILDA